MKTAATLRGYPDRSVVWIAGGELELDGRAVHGSREERELLARGLAEAARAARLAVVFGPAAETVRRGLARAARRADSRRRGLSPAAPPVAAVETLEDAIERALAESSGADAIVVSPMFPLAMADRERVAPALLGRMTSGTRGA